MALENTDLFVAYRPGNQTHYKVSTTQLIADVLPEGTEAGQVLVFDGVHWQAGAIDGGTYA